MQQVQTNSTFLSGAKKNYNTFEVCGMYNFSFFSFIFNLIINKSIHYINHGKRNISIDIFSYQRRNAELRIYNQHNFDLDAENLFSEMNLSSMYFLPEISLYVYSICLLRILSTRC